MYNNAGGRRLKNYTEDVSLRKVNWAPKLFFNNVVLQLLLFLGSTKLSLHQETFGVFTVLTDGCLQFLRRHELGRFFFLEHIYILQARMHAQT